MNKIAIIYWSGTGNTESMAQNLFEGAKAAGATVDLFPCSAFNVSKAGEYDKFALGCPSMGAEELEDSEFLPLYESLKSFLTGKKVILFGSYGWGDGEWMRQWEKDCFASGAIKAHDSFITEGTPDTNAKNLCLSLGQTLAEA